MTCKVCGKTLKRVTLSGGRVAYVCKKPTCKAYMKAVKK